MAEPYQEQEEQSIDLRVYIGMLFFRWHLIVVCFLYALLGAVLYITFAPKRYQASAGMLIYRDPKLVLSTDESPVKQTGARIYVLQAVRSRVVDKLFDRWGKIMGDRAKMLLPVSTAQGSTYGPTLWVSAVSPNADYAREFLEKLIEEHNVEYQSLQMEASVTATRILEDELAKLEEKIRSAEDDVIEYERLHDLARIEARGAAESGYLGSLIGRRVQLATQLMMLEIEYPMLKEENVGVINQVERMTRETAAIKPAAPKATKPGPNSPDTPDQTPVNPDTALAPEAAYAEDPGWQDLRVRLVKLEQEEKELAANLKPEHPRMVELRKEVAAVKEQLALAAEIQLRNMRDRHRALTTHLNAIEDAEYKWQAKDLLTTRRRAELNRIKAVVVRYESNYHTLYSRLHDLRVAEELKAEHYRLINPPVASNVPVWPNAPKILLVGVVLGLGSGFGLALVSQVFDNKIQTIKDVEKTLGLPFLGGVPYWLHGGLERTIRPIVTEEHSTGAIEAYRALRTSVLSALAKINEKIVLVTSADSREGKTLTTLNLAIMIAQMKKRVLLVDMDLRRGRLHRSLGLEREPGVTDALKTGRTLREFVKHSKIENLDLVPTGSSVENCAELLQSSSLVGMFMDVQDEYDYILVDTSPVLRVTDTVIVATQGLGVVLYIARVNHTPKPMIRYSLEMLREARVLGLVMNSIEMHKISSLYYAYQYPNYAYYSNAYAYGYNYYQYGDEDGAGRKSRRAGGATRKGVLTWLRKNVTPSSQG